MSCLLETKESEKATDESSIPPTTSLVSLFEGKSSPSPLSSPGQKNDYVTMNKSGNNDWSGRSPKSGIASMVKLEREIVSVYRPFILFKQLQPTKNEVTKPAKKKNNRVNFVTNSFIHSIPL